MSELDRPQTDLRPYLRRIWRRRRLLGAILIGIPAAIFVISSLLPRTYEATTALKGHDISASASSFGDLRIKLPNTRNAVPLDAPPPPPLKDIAPLAETPEVAQKAARELGEPRNDAQALRDQVSVREVTDEQPTSETDATEVTITARDDSATRAADLANAFATAIADVRTKEAVERIDETIDTLTSRADESQESASAVPGGDAALLNVQVQQLRALRASQGNATEIVAPATPPNGPASPRPLRNAAVGFLLAVLLSAGLVALLHALDRRVGEPDALEGLVGAPLLAKIPDAAFRGRPARAHVVEAFQTLRSALTYFNVDRSLSSVVVASPDQGDGKTTVATNLAIALARAEMNVILIDADLRRSPVAARLGVNAHYGLDSVLFGETSVADALEEVDVDGGRLRVLSGGLPPPDPAVLLGSSKMSSLLAEVTEQADMVLIDTPSALVVSDVIPLLAQASGVLLVARMNHTSRDDLARAVRLIASARGSLVGVVATGVRFPAGFGYEDRAHVEGEIDREGAGGGRRKSPAILGKPVSGAARGVRRLLSRSGRGTA